MKDRTATILRIFLAVLLVISAVLFVIFYTRGEEFTNIVLTWSYILLALTAALTLIFPILYFISNPKKGKNVLIGIVGFAVLYFISYALTDGSTRGDVYEEFEITESTSHFIGAMLYMTFILGGLAILSIVFTGISSLFK
ncbi:MAG: hypothetical protein ACLFPE_03740 [Bacteroidales bacterium]